MPSPTVSTPEEETRKYITFSQQTQERQELSRFVFDRFTAMKLSRQNPYGANDGNWDRWDRMFRNITSGPPPEDWMANVFVPFVMSTELAVLSEITEGRMDWKTLPRGPEDMPKADLVDAIKRYSQQKGNWDDEQYRFDHEKVHYGTGIWKEVYREDRRVIREKTKDKNGRSIFKTKDIREFEDVYGYCVHVRNFYLDNLATSIIKARDCVERNVMDVGAFRTRFRKYQRQAGRVPPYSFASQPVSDEVVERTGSGGDTNREGTYLPISPEALKEDEVEVIEYWNRPRDMHVIMANGLIVVDEPIPYDHKHLPYAMDTMIPIPNSAWGLGIPQVLEGPQEELNTMHNMMIDEAKLGIHKPILVSGRTLLDEDEYQLRPRGIIPVEDPQGARELSTTGVGQYVFQIFEEVKQTARVAVGLDPMAFLTTRGETTATEEAIKREAALRRIRLINRSKIIRALPRIARLRVANIIQFYSDPLRVEQIMGSDKKIMIDEETGLPKVKKVNRTITVNDEKGPRKIEVDPEEIRNLDVDVEIIPQTTFPVSQAVLQKRIATVFQIVTSFPPAMQLVNLPQLIRHLFKANDIPEAIVKDIEPETKGPEDAEDENERMMNGEEIPPTKGATPEHTAIHIAAMFIVDPRTGQPTNVPTPVFSRLSEEQKLAFFAHVQEELNTHAAAGTIQGQIQNQGRTSVPQPGEGFGVTERNSEGAIPTALPALQGGR